jgi:hypothetical protein
MAISLQSSAKAIRLVLSLEKRLSQAKFLFDYESNESTRMEPLSGSGRFYLPVWPLSGTAREMHFVAVPSLATFVAIGFWLCSFFGPVEEASTGQWALRCLLFVLGMPNCEWLVAVSCGDCFCQDRHSG